MTRTLHDPLYAGRSPAVAGKVAIRVILISTPPSPDPEETP